ncbi:hypothetical protein CAPTEDRAFT_226427 [Capitella teleta]|uniref:EGF-like domain-containing protein n=1 Tax=Capitella teleta TaxID=283909 RepID=R7U711_CAPTE|nr:hypothetical protein CAPTEDRAFT_226427 [Capitella teleta]|eukprot:ELU02155.1 hypothetical protein CAPTEDRAFT_226427 [Capitella teleta]
MALPNDLRSIRDMRRPPIKLNGDGTLPRPPPSSSSTLQRLGSMKRGDSLESSRAVSCPPSPPLPPYPSNLPDPPDAEESFQQPNSHGGEGGGGATLPRGMYKNTLVTFSLVATLSVVYAATCSMDKGVNIVLTMPPIVNFKYVRVFQNKQFYNLVDDSAWHQKNNSKVQMLDTNECDVLENACPASSRCENTDGGHVCHCPPSHFHQGLSCVNPAYPVLISEDETLPVFLDGLRVEASPNVFLENLHNTKNLKTRLYATDKKQSTDFFWFRDASRKIRINIGLADPNLIPEYEDVDHEGDNGYIQSNPNYNNEIQDLRKITQNFCRNPLPDYYTITLQIAKDRMTNATTRMCDVTLFQKGQCPRGIRAGETFTHRTLNDPCHKQGTYPEEIQQAPNNIVCTEGNSALLRDIFNITPAAVNDISFPPRNCKLASKDCQKCLDKEQCRSLGRACVDSREIQPDLRFFIKDSSVKKCCQLDCYSSLSCKTSFSDECQKAITECAMGAAYQFTLQPFFNNLNEEFHCHIRQRKPKMLYRLWFYVSVLGTGFETPRIYRSIYADDVESLTQGTYELEFLTIEHDAGIQVEDEFILRGQRSDNKWNFTLNSLKKPKEYNDSDIEVRTYSEKIHVGIVQFAGPFAYSTSTWSGGNNCRKDLSLIKAKQKHYDENQAQPANVVVEAVRRPYKYFIRSTKESPLIRFITPANISILSWWFRDKEPYLIIDDTLTATLSLSPDNRVWEILLAGRLTGCPGYLNVVINDRDEVEELFRYDTIISCPPVFNITFKIPNWGVKEDKTFDLLLDDAKQQYRLFLTNIDISEEAANDNNGALEMKVTGAWMAQEAVAGGLPLLAVIVIIVLCMAVGFVLSYVALELTKRFSHGSIKYRKIDKYSPSCCSVIRKMGAAQLAVTIAYITYRLVYSLVFTFTLFFMLLLVCLRDDLHTFAHLGQIQNKHMEQTHSLHGLIEKHTHDQVFRQTHNVEDMQGACNHYISELTSSMLYKIGNFTGEEAYQTFLDSEYSVTTVVQEKLDKIMIDYRDRIETFASTLSSIIKEKIDPNLVKYNTFVDNIYANGWLEFSQRIFNQSQVKPDLPQDDMIAAYQEKLQESVIFGDSIDFASFLEIQEVENVQLWALQFWERFNRTVPLSYNITLLNNDQLACPGGGSDFGGALDALSAASREQRDSSLFFSDDPEILKEDIFAQDPPAVFAEDSDLSIDLSVQILVNSVDWFTLQMIFICMDLLLFFYRMCHLYLVVCKFCYGFDDAIELTSKEVARAQEIMQKPDAEETADELLFSPDTWKQKAQENHVHSRPAKENGDVSGGKSDYQSIAELDNKQNDRKQSVVNHRTVLRRVCKRLVQSEIIPKMVFGSVIVVFACIALQRIECYMQLDMLLIFSGLASVLINLDRHLVGANLFLDTLAQQLSSSMMTWFPNHTSTELTAVKELLDFFTNEHRSHMEAYRAQSCSLTSNNCTLPAPAHFNYTIPVLPCNFVPVSSQNYPEHEYIRMEEAMLDGLLPVVDAAQGIAWTSFGMLIGVVLSVLALHLIGVLTSHAIKTRHLFPVRSAYVIYGGSVRGLRCFAPKERYDSPEPPVSPSRMDRTLETDDTDCCTAPSSPASTLPGYKAASNDMYLDEEVSFKGCVRALAHTMSKRKDTKLVIKRLLAWCSAKSVHCDWIVYKAIHKLRLYAGVGGMSFSKDLYSYL